MTTGRGGSCRKVEYRGRGGSCDWSISGGGMAHFYGGINSRWCRRSEEQSSHHDLVEKKTAVVVRQSEFELKILYLLVFMFI